MNRRQALEALRAGPALLTDFPADAVDVDGLLAHLIARGFEGGIYLADLEMESLVWVYDGEAQDVWFFDVDGGETVLAGPDGHGVFREMAAHGSTLSVYVGAPPEVALGQADGAPSAAPAARARATAAPSAVEPAAPPGEAGPPEPIVGIGPTPAAAPSARPWPRILEGVAERVARHRGQRLAERFTATLAAALAPHGGGAEAGRVWAPPLSEPTWRGIVEAACAPVVAVAGRAFVDRSIAAAEEDARTAHEPGADR